MSLNRFQNSLLVTTMIIIIITHHNHHHHHRHCSHFDHHHVDDQGMGTIQVGETSNKAVVNIAIGDGGSFGELALIYGGENYDNMIIGDDDGDSYR